MEKVTVKRDGTVMVGTKAIGRIEKVDHHSFGSLMFGGNPAQWFQAVNASGENVGSPKEKRRDAVRLLTEYAEPPSVKFEMCNSARAFFGGNSDRFVNAQIHWKGYYISASRYPDEMHWVVDALFVPGSLMPTFSNGAGTRVTNPQFLGNEIAEWTNAQFVVWAKNELGED